MNRRLRAKKSKWCRTYRKRCTIVDSIAATIIGLFGLGLATGGAPFFGAPFMAFSILTLVEAFRPKGRQDD